jgi:phosphodiesterase/alkaline phosphatase D-like protein
MARRALGVAVVAAALLTLSISAAPAEVVFDGVAAGDPSASDVILWSRAENGGTPIELKAQIATDAAFADIVGTLAGTTSAAADYTLKLAVTGLASNTHYFYRFVAPDGSVSAIGQFWTAPAPNEKAEVRFAFSGDADGRFRPYPAIAGIASHKLNFFIFLGDTMYETADAASPAVPIVTGETADPLVLANALAAYNRKYLNNVRGVDPAGRPSASGQQGLQPMFAATASYTLLDNHELGNRSLQSGGAPPIAPQGTSDPVFDVNTTGNFNNKTLAFQTIEKSYLDYHPTRAAMLGTPATGYRLTGPQVTAAADPRSNGTPQLYFAQQWGANCIYVQTDDRSYRDIRLAKLAGNRTSDDIGSRADNPERTMLGSTQLQWLEATLLQVQKDGIPWKFVAISSPIDQVGGAPAQDGKSWWGGYRSERNRMLKFIADNRIDHVVFLTTDDHQTRVSQLQYLTDPADPNSKASLGDGFQIVTGPIGAGGPDKFVDHSFAAVQMAADRASAGRVAEGQPPLGLPATFPGLHGVFRQGDPDTAAPPSPVDFSSPDTFNYTVLTVAANGNLTVETWGIPSYSANTFPQSAAASGLILGFQIALTDSGR